MNLSPTHRALVSAAALSFSTLTTGCMLPSYAFEPRPVTTNPRGSACYAEEHLSLATGSFWWTRNLGSYTTVSRDVSSGQLRLSVGRSATANYGNSGLTVYQGNRLLTSQEALDIIGDPEVAAAQAEVLSATQTGSDLYPAMRVSMWGLGGLGVASTAVGTVWLLADASGESNAPAYTLLAGAGLLMASLIPALIGYFQLPDYVFHERDQKLLVHREIARATADAAEIYNRRVADRCGAPPQPLPMTDQAREMLTSP